MAAIYIVVHVYDILLVPGTYINIAAESKRVTDAVVCTLNQTFPLKDPREFIAREMATGGTERGDLLRFRRPNENVFTLPSAVVRRSVSKPSPTPGSPALHVRQVSEDETRTCGGCTFPRGVGGPPIDRS